MKSGQLNSIHILLAFIPAVAAPSEENYGAIKQLSACQSSQRKDCPPQKFQRLPRGQFLECLAVIRIQLPFYYRAACRRESNEYRAHRLFRRAATWPGDASHGDGEVRAGI